MLASTGSISIVHEESWSSSEQLSFSELVVLCGTVSVWEPKSDVMWTTFWGQCDGSAPSESSSPRSTLGCRSSVLYVLVSLSNSLKLLWVLRALGDQPYCTCALVSVSPPTPFPNLLSSCSWISCRSSTWQRIDPQTLLLDSQLAENSLWSEGAKVSYFEQSRVSLSFHQQTVSSDHICIIFTI